MFIPHTLRNASLLVVAGLAASSCISPPEYPETPEIEFKRITQQRINDNTGTYDKLVITIGYKDGDGDLGIRTNEIDPNQSTNPNSYNYVCTLQLRNSNNQFVDFNFTPQFPGYSGQYPYLRPAEQGDRKAPLKGDLDYNINLFQSPPYIQAGTVLRFKVKIKDRALHESNEVVTSAITIQP
ncbi:hypothetical protein [Hymenobacter pini]|uniref:hypothetical protein n=1 Tax=Hymenobacter pini TaxID=2880879 RepID=UPI001CF58649|nr:hypothetical protein [Hymenobacter pini]MCA8829626.1 hypothetical protein [Hymenobacter pini]